MSIVQKTFITAVYLRQTELAEKLLSYASETLQQPLDAVDITNFVNKLPPPLYFQAYPTNYAQLPSQQNPQGQLPPQQLIQPPHPQQHQQQPTGYY